jgi:hypothetical protein
MRRYGEASIENVAGGKGTLEIWVTFEKEIQVACSKFVGQEEEIGVKKVIETC